MESALNTFNSAVGNIPGFGIVSGLYQDKVGDYVETKDPFYEPVPGEPDKKRRRQPPPGITEEQRKLWKKIMHRAWYHDRNFCNCFSIDLGIGMIGIVAIIPFIGSYYIYKMHAKMLLAANKAGAPAKLQATMAANVATDTMRAIIPLLGTLLCWMGGCSTRNAALFDNWLRREMWERDRQERMQQSQRSVPSQPRRPPPGHQQPLNGGYYQENSAVGQQPVAGPPGSHGPQRPNAPDRRRPLPGAQPIPPNGLRDQHIAQTQTAGSFGDPDVRSQSYHPAQRPYDPYQPLQSSERPYVQSQPHQVPQTEYPPPQPVALAGQGAQRRPPPSRYAASPDTMAAQTNPWHSSLQHQTDGYEIHSSHPQAPPQVPDHMPAYWPADTPGQQQSRQGQQRGQQPGVQHPQRLRLPEAPNQFSQQHPARPPPSQTRVRPSPGQTLPYPMEQSTRANMPYPPP